MNMSTQEALIVAIETLNLDADEWEEDPENPNHRRVAHVRKAASRLQNLLDALR